MKTREELKKYLFGNGIEIGALQNPMDISDLDITDIKYVDRLSAKDLRRHYPELNELPLVDPDILDDGQVLQSVKNNSQDFIIANHLIEHLDNPLLALENWSKKLKEGGVIFMAVPDKRYTFDKQRELTPIDHLITDYEASEEHRGRNNFDHYLEWAKYINKALETNLESQAIKLKQDKYSIHFHVWTFESFFGVLRYLIEKMELPLEIVDYSRTLKGGNEFIFILRKTSSQSEDPRKITDIIIPVFNGYSFFQECFRSIIANTKKGSYRIVLVDDCSDEKEIIDYFREIESLYFDSLTLMRNKNNLGFVKSVNRGMKHSESNDVILLNSDTVVTPNWIDKLRQCANGDGKIATVTPLTNNGTICSIPKWLQDNRLPDGHTVESFSLLVEKASKKECLELPTAVGFCMYIKRDALKEIGFFDEEKYGKGYGEENDFSLRAIQKGLKNILDDATFIYHKGHMSFSESDFKILTRENSKKLLDRFPNYEKEVASFIEKKPLANIISRINSATEEFRRNNILFFIHAEPYTRIGGSEKHTLDMLNIFKNHFNFTYLFYFDDDRIFLERMSRHKGSEVVLSLPIKYDHDLEKEFDFSKINDIFANILDFYHIDTIHFQHVLNAPLSLIETAKKKVRKMFLTVHDYYLYCPHPHLLHDKISQNRCLNLDCEKCQDPDLKPNVVANRRARISTLLKNFDKIVFPSNYIRNNFSKFYPEHKIRFETIEHPYPIPTIKNSPATEKTDRIEQTNSKNNLAFLGYFSKHKGSEIFRDFVLRNKNRFNFFIFGRIEDRDSFEKIRRAVVQFEYSNYQDLEKLTHSNKIDAFLLLSIVPESFSFTLTESILLGIPIVASNLGVFPERLQSTINSRLFEIDASNPEKTISQLAETVEHLLAKKGGFQTVKSPLQNTKNYNERIIKKYLDLYIS